MVLDCEVEYGLGPVVCLGELEDFVVEGKELRDDFWVLDAKESADNVDVDDEVSGPEGWCLETRELANCFLCTNRAVFEGHNALVCGVFDEVGIRIQELEIKRLERRLDD